MNTRPKWGEIGLFIYYSLPSVLLYHQVLYRKPRWTENRGGESTEKGSCLHLMSGPISMSSLRILYYLHLMQPLQILYYEAKSPIYSVDHSKLLIDRSSVQMHTLEVSCLWKEEQFSKLQLAPCKSSQLFSKIGWSTSPWVTDQRVDEMVKSSTRKTIQRKHFHFHILLPHHSVL